MSMYLPNPAVRRAESDPVEFIELPPMAHEGDGETSMSVDASEIRGATQPQARVDLTRRAGNYVTELVPKSSGDSEDVRSIIHDLHYHITRHGPPQSLLKQLVAPVETRMLSWTNLPLADVLDGRARVAFGYDGAELEAEHGGPARLLVPHLHLWKSASESAAGSYWTRTSQASGRCRLPQLRRPMAGAAVLGRLIQALAGGHRRGNVPRDGRGILSWPRSRARWTPFSQGCLPACGAHCLRPPAWRASVPECASPSVASDTPTASPMWRSGTAPALRSGERSGRSVALVRAAMRDRDPALGR
jgi:Oxidoreductase molybdopterin binding domain